MNKEQLDRWLASDEYKALLARIHADAAVALKAGVQNGEVQQTIAALCDAIEDSIDYRLITNPVRRMHPQQWCHKFGVEVIDPDGWRSAGMDYHTPITQDQFLGLFRGSTTGFVNREKFLVYRHLFG
jgi:hypothetical protein